ncbi:MAG: sulfatase [Armatimonadota bacterium]
MNRQPNLVFIFADQMRAQAVGFMGNDQVRTPNLDTAAKQGMVFEHAVSSCPVCTPYRASLLTGRYPLSNGMVLNDVRLPVGETTIADVLKGAGYETGYIGKWHLDGPMRGGFTPPGPRRQGFDYWAVANCTHSYMRSYYYRDTPEPIWIDGYDADHQTDLAIEFMRRHTADPFCLFVSWGPPHGPYNQMPEKYKTHKPEDIRLRPNCTAPKRDDISGYYSHIGALDRDFGRIMAALDELDIADNTILVFTSDHGDMLGSQGEYKKQKPWDESIMVPFVMRYPDAVPAGRRTPALINVVDLMPTLLSLMGVAVPGSVEGTDLSPIAKGADGPRPESAFLQHACPFIERISEWRGVRTERYTYVRALEGPWLLYDNEKDPYQLQNLVGETAHAALEAKLDADLEKWLERTNDDFQPREVYWRRFGYEVDDRKQMPYINKVGQHEL